MKKSYDTTGHISRLQAKKTAISFDTTASFVLAVLFCKSFYFFVNSFCVQFIFMNQLNRRSGFSKPVIHADTHHLCRCLFTQYFRYRASKSTDYGMFLNGYDFLRLCCRCNNQFLVNRLDGMDIDYFCRIPSFSSIFAASKDSDTSSPVAKMVTSVPSFNTIPFPISNL